jgi:predicted protein tyrosine phosphatase
MTNTPNTETTVTSTYEASVTPIPTVRSLRESRAICKDYDAVLTAGPKPFLVRDFRHPNHIVVQFDDITLMDYPSSPSVRDVERMLSWGVDQRNLLVHCQEGVSRSTATAWGIAIAGLNDPLQSLKALWENHPNESRVGHPREGMKREFRPNELIIMHIEDILSYDSGTLIHMCHSFLQSQDPNYRRYAVWGSKKQV